MKRGKMIRAPEKFSKISLIKAKLEGKSRTQLLDEVAEEWENNLRKNFEIDKKVKKYAKFPKL